MERQLCHLHRALGRVEGCPGEACPLFDEEKCVIAGLRAELPSNPPLAQLLLGIRDGRSASIAARTQCSRPGYATDASQDPR